MTILSGGNVGIGTTTPAATLDVKGAVNFSGATSGYMAIAVPATVTTSYTLTFPAAVGASGQVLQTTNGTGTLGWVTPSAAGSQTPWTAIENAAGYTLQGNSTANGNMTIDSTSSGTKGYVLLNPSGGNVGIGNSTPAATLSLGTAGTRAGSLYLAGGTANGVTVNVPASVTAAYTITLPAAAPSANGQALTATTAGVASWTTIAAGSQTPWTSNINGGGYTLTNLGTNITAAAGLTIASTGAALALNSGSGALTSNATTVTLGGSATMYGGAAASGKLTLDSTSSGTKGYTIINPSGGNVGIANVSPSALLTLGTAGTKAGTMSFAGSTSGTVTVQPAAAAGTWALTLPTTAGTNGQVLQTDGTGVTSWAAASSGSSGPVVRYVAWGTSCPTDYTYGTIPDLVSNYSNNASPSPWLGTYNSNVSYYVNAGSWTAVSSTPTYIGCILNNAPVRYVAWGASCPTNYSFGTFSDIEANWSNSNDGGFSTGIYDNFYSLYIQGGDWYMSSGTPSYEVCVHN